MISIEQVKELRNKTGISVMQCKKALEEAGGDIERALILLKRKGTEIALKKTSRELGAGTIASYIHSNGKIGVLVELLCETDFVAKNKEFKTLADDLTMHVAAMNPQFLKNEDVDNDTKKKVEEAFAVETKKIDKPEEIKKKILEGKISAYFKEKVLMTQAFIKDQDTTIEELISRAVQKTGERIEIARFVRYELLEE